MAQKAMKVQQEMKRKGGKTKPPYVTPTVKASASKTQAPTALPDKTYEFQNVGKPWKRPSTGAVVATYQTFVPTDEEYAVVMATQERFKLVRTRSRVSR